MKPLAMDCKTCGKENTDHKVVIFGPPDQEVQFSMNNGKGVICLDCWKKAQEAKS
jgi:hypothetical protein